MYAGVRQQRFLSIRGVQGKHNMASAFVFERRLSCFKYHSSSFQRNGFLSPLSVPTGEDCETAPEARLQHDMQDQIPGGKRGGRLVPLQSVQFLPRTLLAERVPRRGR